MEEPISFEDVVFIIQDFFGEENVDVQMDLSRVLIRFPLVIISNEYDESTEITNLFVEQFISSEGCSLGTFKMLRTEYTEDQIASGYSHSHIPHVHLPIRFQTPCLGTGPIRGTLTMLAVNPSEDLWKMYCLELKKYVETESVAGTPYVYIRNIGNTQSLAYDRTARLYMLNDITIPIIEKEFINYIIERREIDFSYCNGYHVALSRDEFIIALSNLFIDFINQLPEEKYNEIEPYISGILIKGKYKGNRVEIVQESTINRLDAYYEQEGTEILRFKNEPYKLHIIKNKNNQEYFIYVLPYNILGRIEKILMDKVNCEYGTRKTYNQSIQAVRYF